MAAFVHSISISRTELQTFSIKINYNQITDQSVQSPYFFCLIIAGPKIPPPPLPQKILHNFVFAFSWDDRNTQEKLRKIALQNLGG